MLSAIYHTLLSQTWPHVGPQLSYNNSDGSSRSLEITISMFAVIKCICSGNKKLYAYTHDFMLLETA